MPEDSELFHKEKGKGGLSAKGPGGIPVWGYGVGIAGAVVAFMYFRGSKTAAAAGQPGTGQPGTGQYGTETVSVSGGGGQTWYPPWRGGGGPGPSPGPAPAPATNEQWGQLVTDWLISKAENPGDVADTINNYLDGRQLDTDERAMIDLATNIWGQPPQTPIPMRGDGNPQRRRHAPKFDPGGPDRDPQHDPFNPGGPNRHTREQTMNSGGGNQGTGKTVVIVE